MADLNIYETDCWKCKARMKVALLFTGAEFLDPAEFQSELIELSLKQGVKIEFRSSNMLGESYYANVCPACNHIFGRLFLHDLWYDKPVMKISVHYKNIQN